MFENQEHYDSQIFIKEIKSRYQFVDMGKQSDLGKPNHESPSYYYSEEGLEDNDELI